MRGPNVRYGNATDTDTSRRWPCFWHESQPMSSFAMLASISVMLSLAGYSTLEMHSPRLRCMRLPCSPLTSHATSSSQTARKSQEPRWCSCNVSRCSCSYLFTTKLPLGRLLNRRSRLHPSYLSPSCTPQFSNMTFRTCRGIHFAKRSVGDLRYKAPPWLQRSR